MLQASTFSVEVVGGKIVLKSTQGGGTVELPSHIKTYSDGNWHYVSIMKDGIMYVQLFMHQICVQFSSTSR